MKGEPQPALVRDERRIRDHGRALQLSLNFDRGRSLSAGQELRQQRRIMRHTSLIMFSSFILHSVFLHV